MTSNSDPITGLPSLISESFPESLANRLLNANEGSLNNEINSNRKPYIDASTQEGKGTDYYAVRNEINLLILNYLIYEGYVNAARDFSEELGLKFISEKLREVGVEEEGEARALADERNEFDDGYNSAKLEEEGDVDGGGYFDVDKFFEPHAIEDDINQAYKAILYNPDQATVMIGLDKFQRLTSGLSTIQVRNKIKLLILNGDVDEAINLINIGFPSLLDRNQYIYFKLLHLALIEKIRRQFSPLNGSSEEASDRKFLSEVLGFISAKLSGPNVLQSKKFLKELELTMALLCFGDQFREAGGAASTKIPRKLRNLMDLKLRSGVANMVNRSIILHINSDDLVGGSEVLSSEQFKIGTVDFDKKRTRKRGDDSTDLERNADEPENEEIKDIDKETATAEEKDKVSKLHEMQSELQLLEDRLERPEGVKLVRLVKLMIWSFGCCHDSDSTISDNQMAVNVARLEEALSAMLK
ncbi:DEKNAAC100651 [Brettanomyces naardenensis]|uniref:DEKNAAC100651 n=1 Tax=Brettanomyces naardenensis TaxID=13370 RepID=A0A448YFA9_BRENA|nr:DEKNAAC100651 [Brettanomyces naardenensis]